MILQELPVFNNLTNAFPARYTPVPDADSTTQPRMGFFTDTTLCIGCKRPFLVH